MKHLGHQGIGPNDALPEHFGTNNRLNAEIQRLATRDSAEYLYNLEKQPEYIPAQEPETFATLDASKALLRQQAVERCTIADGFVAEYGVNKGESFTQLCELFKDQSVYGFDAFLGLPGQIWEGNMIHKGAFDHGGNIPFAVPNNGVIVNGWFNKTLPGFDYKKTVAKYIHIDCDVYSSTKEILNTMSGKIVTGTIVVFDDYFNHQNWRQGEHRAWQEFVAENKIKYRYLYVAGMATAIQVD